MPRAPRIPPRRLPESVRRRLEVSTAMAWESLVETHTRQARMFTALLEERFGLEDALGLYLAEMDLDEAMAAAIRTRVLADVEQRGEEAPGAQGTIPLPEPDPESVPDAAAASDDEDDDEWWRRLRPDVVVRDVVRRQREADAEDTELELALARAEEAVILTHVDNAISFVALLGENLSINRAVRHYLGAVVLSGSRAQSVHQRAMARLADVHLPRA